MVDNGENEEELMAEFITRYYTIRDDVPKQLTLDREIEDSKLLTKWLSEKKGLAVHIVVPKIGDQKHLVDMCKKNAIERLAQTKGSTTVNMVCWKNLKKF